MRSKKLQILAVAAFSLLAAPPILAEEAAPGAAPVDDALIDAPEAEPTAAPAPAGEVAESLPDVVEPTAAAEAPEPADPTVAGELAEADSADAGRGEETAGLSAPTEDVEIPLDEEIAPPEAVPSLAEAAEGQQLGVVAYDSEGHAGRIHIVRSGDTLWDISDWYLGTPWVWPSIWMDNGEIENPHLIHPGDHIWITPTEMRRLTPEEAEVLLSNAPPEPEATPAAVDEVPLATEEAPAPELVIEAPVAGEERGRFRVSARESAGLITPEQLDASASIVGQVPERILMSQEDEVYIGLGESEVERGDEFTIFRTREKVFDPDTGALLGYHVEFTGWVRVEETFPETSLASIRMSNREVERGDRLIPREPLPQEVPLQVSPEGVEGKISYFPDRRELMGFADFVYLNRGTLDGVEVGSPLEVYRPGRTAEEPTRRDVVDIPDRVIAQLVVVRAAEDASVAYVRSSDTELKMGDRVRGAGM
jgi:hypothetical protein